MRNTELRVRTSLADYHMTAERDEHDRPVGACNCGTCIDFEEVATPSHLQACHWNMCCILPVGLCMFLLGIQRLRQMPEIYPHWQVLLPTFTLQRAGQLWVRTGCCRGSSGGLEGHPSLKVVSALLMCRQQHCQWTYCLTAANRTILLSNL